MKNLIPFVILSFIISSCNLKRKCYECTPPQKERVASFLSDNIKGANNMSDEEMEHVISELRFTGIVLFCEQITIPVNLSGVVVWDELDIDSLNSLYYYQR